jgi:hypothetical protein
MTMVIPNKSHYHKYDAIKAQNTLTANNYQPTNQPSFQQELIM